jgi:hypothetical protein
MNFAASKYGQLREDRALGAFRQLGESFWAMSMAC